jgi:Zn-dependent protease with chaperone function
MLEQVPGSPYIAAAVVLAAALLRWWWGRGIAALVDDPAFPERLAAHRLRNTKAFGVAVGLLIAGWMDYIYWTLPLFLLACSLASFQLRRTVYQETWSVGRYVSFFTRAIVAMWGFWGTLAMFPALAHAAGSKDWIVALAVGGVLAVWNYHYSDFLRLVIGTRRIDNAALTERFTAVAQAANTRMPTFEVVDLRGGAMTNAFALPSSSRPGVIFTDGLLTKLESDEIVAICGHELAHLEHFSPVLMRRLNIQTYALIAAGVGATLVARSLDGSQMMLLAGWFMVVAIFMAWRVRDRQKHETESDLRAVALTGNPEALARGLIKIYAFNHVPRRMDVDVERQSTHPSLAKRIRDIRAMAAAPRPAIDLNATFTEANANGRIRAMFAQDHLHWQEGDAATHTLSYAHLAELRVRVSTSGPARLLAVERHGRRWEMALEPGDVARAQAVLDRVDGRLAGAATTSNLWPGVGRIVALAIAMFATMAMCTTVVWVAIAAFLRPVRTMLAAVGAAAVAGVFLTLRDPSSMEWAKGLSLPWVPFALAAAGVVAVVAALKSQPDQNSKTDNRLLYVLGLIAALSVAIVLLQSTSAVRLHQAARAITTAVIFPMAVAGALALRPGRVSRLLACVSSLVGIGIAVVGSMTFLGAAGRDLMLVPSGPLTRVDLTRSPARQFDLPLMASDVRLSPAATHIAARDPNSDDDDSMVFHVGRPDQELTRIVADDLQFVDDTRALAARNTVEGTELSEIVLDPKPAVGWRYVVPDVHRAQLSTRAGSPRWLLVGWDRSRHLLRAEGQIGSTDVTVKRWSVPVDRQVWPRNVAASQTSAVLVETRFDSEAFNGETLGRILDIFNPYAMYSRVWHLEQDRQTQIGTSYLADQCFPNVYAEDRLVCAAFDGVRTHLVTIDATARVEPFATVDGHFSSYGHSSAGWLTGWWDSTPTAIRLRTREAFAMPDDGEETAMGTAVSDRWIGSVMSQGRGARVLLYPLER